MVPTLNEALINHSSDDMPLGTIREKYEDLTFYEVAKMRVIPTKELLEMIAEVNNM